MLDQVNNINDLKNYTTTSLTAGDTLIVSGYYSPGDGGGGEFFWTPYQVKVNGPGYLEGPENVTVDPLDVNLYKNQAIEFTGGGILTLTSDAFVGDTVISGVITINNLSDNEEGGTKENNGSIIEPSVGGVGRWIRLIQEPYLNVKWYGATGNGTTDDTVAIVNASAEASDQSKKVFYPNGTYLVTNFHRKIDVLHFGDSSHWKVGTVNVPIPLEDDTTWEDMVIYVDPSGSDTQNHGLSSNYPYETIQYAYDSIPKFLKNEIKISLSSGTHSANYLEGSSDPINFPRNAVLYGRGKITSSRTQRVSNVLTANIIIEGKGKDHTKIQTSSGLDYGIYNTQGQLGLKDLTIAGNKDNLTSALLVSHRGFSYVHGDDIAIDGVCIAKTAEGAYAESSGQLELVDAEIKNCSIGLKAQTSGDNVVFSGSGSIHQCNIGVFATGSSWVKLQVTGTDAAIRVYNNNTYALQATSNAYLEARGNASFDILIEDPCLAEQGVIYFVVATISARVSGTYGSNIYMNNVNYSEDVIMRASELGLKDTNSYIAPATQSNVKNPIIATSGSVVFRTGMNEIIGSGNEGGTYNVPSITVSSNGAVINVYDSDENPYKAIRLDGGGAVRTGCQFGIDGVFEGQQLYVYGDTWGVELINDTNLELPSPIIIGNGSGQYSGATFIFDRGKWRLVGIGIQN